MASNPSPNELRDATKSDNRNDGFEQTSGRNGQKIIRSYGNDRSTVVGSAQMERGTPRGLAGGPTDLSHSLGGVKANQRGG